MTQPLQTLRVWSMQITSHISYPSMAEEQCQQSRSALYYQLLNGSLLWCQHAVKKNTEKVYRHSSTTSQQVLVEQLKNLGPRAHKWLQIMLSKYITENKIPKLWRQSKIIAILKPGKYSATPKSYIHISLLCHTYKLYERIIIIIVLYNICIAPYSTIL